MNPKISLDWTLVWGATGPGVTQARVATGELQNSEGKKKPNVCSKDYEFEPEVICMFIEQKFHI